MKREQIKEIVEGITDEQLDKVMSLHGDTVNKSNLKATDLQTKLDSANATIKTLEASKGDTAALTEELEKYKKDEANRKAADEKAQEEAVINDRFTAVSKESKFINDFTKGGVLSEFKDALSKDENKGKGDADIYAAITKDRADIFVNPNAPKDIPPVGKPDALDGKVEMPKFF